MFDKFVINSATEGANDSNASFWSNTHGWTNLVCATHFTLEERLTLQLPVSCNNDARWMPMAHAYDPSLITFAEIAELSARDIASADAIEIQGVREEDGVCEVCNDRPHFFSTYIHQNTGGCQCIGDFGSYQKAHAHAELLAKQHGWPIKSFVPERFTHA